MSRFATVNQLINILKATPLHLHSLELEQPIAGITTDTRRLKSGEVFLALSGEKFDGHAFLNVAQEKGAVAAIVNCNLTNPPQDFPLLQVQDTLTAYQAIAHWWRNQFQTPVIAVTGSVGKTTTKELIAAVLETQGQVLKTQANYNNEIGVPKTLLELNSDHAYAVIEMGMRGSGEIALLTQIARPDIAVITNVGVAHIERLGSEAAIARAKCELLAEMPATGVAILNHDNSRLLETAATVWQGRTLTYGLQGGDLQGKLIDSDRLQVGTLSLPLPLPGEHNALNYLAALAVAQVFQISWEPLTRGLTVNLPSGRAQRYELPDDIWILDESYNAGPESMVAALRLLAQTSGQRHIAVLGTMRELGERSPEFHRQVGAAAEELKLDQLLVLAEDREAEALITGAGSLPSERCLDHASLIQRLQEIIQPGDRLLFKASRAVGLDQVVAALRALKSGKN